MKCPHCGSEETRVYKTDPYQDVIKRRRECKACRKVFMTLEEFEDRLPEANFRRQLKASGGSS